MRGILQKDPNACGGAVCWYILVEFKGKGWSGNVNNVEIPQNYGEMFSVTFQERFRVLLLLHPI